LSQYTITWITSAVQTTIQQCKVLRLLLSHLYMRRDKTTTKLILSGLEHIVCGVTHDRQVL